MDLKILRFFSIFSLFFFAERNAKVLSKHLFIYIDKHERYGYNYTSLEVHHYVNLFTFIMINILIVNICVQVAIEDGSI